LRPNGTGRTGEPLRSNCSGGAGVTSTALGASDTRKSLRAGRSGDTLGVDGHCFGPRGACAISPGTVNYAVPHTSLIGNRRMAGNGGRRCEATASERQHCHRGRYG
jgi:hypothetical protein